MTNYTRKQKIGQINLIKYCKYHAKGFVPLDHYISTDTKLRIKNPFGVINIITPHIFENGHFPYQYVGELKLIRYCKKYAKGFKPLDSYKGYNQLMTFLTPFDDKEKVTVENFEYGARGRKYLEECHFRGYMKRYAKGFKMISAFKSITNKVKIQDPYGIIYRVQPRDFMNGKRSKRYLGQLELQNYIKNHAKGYKLLSLYKRNDFDVKLKCPHGHIISMTPNNFESGSRCIRCKGDKQTLEYRNEFTKYVKKYAPSYKVLGFGYGALNKVKMLCPKGHIFYVQSGKFRYGIRCPVCRFSRGEHQVIKMLKLLHLSFNYGDTNLVSPLHLDFVVKANNQLVGIEVDGIQHLRPVGCFGGQLSFVRQQYRDIVKNLKCLKKHIPLIRIKYPSKNYHYLVKGIKWLVHQIKNNQKVPQGIHYFY